MGAPAFPRRRGADQGRRLQGSASYLCYHARFWRVIGFLRRHRWWGVPARRRRSLQREVMALRAGVAALKDENAAKTLPDEVEVSCGQGGGNADNGDGVGAGDVAELVGEVDYRICRTTGDDRRRDRNVEAAEVQVVEIL